MKEIVILIYYRDNGWKWCISKGNTEVIIESEPIYQSKSECIAALKHFGSSLADIKNISWR